MKNTDSSVVDVLDFSPNEVEIHFCDKEHLTFDLMKALGVDEFCWVGCLYLIEDNDAMSYTPMAISNNSFLTCLKTADQVIHHCAKDGYAVYQCGNNVCVCGLNGKEITPIVGYSTRTSSFPWEGLRTMAISEIAREEGLEFYGYPNYFQLVNLPKRERKGRNGRKRNILSENYTLSESLFQ